jgi:class 3 adenylate cyclase
MTATVVAEPQPGRRPVPVRAGIVAFLVALLLLGLPLCVWLDLRNLSDRTLRLQADELSYAINNIRDYYSHNVVGRVLANNGETHVVSNYREVAGGIPLPATLSLELGEVVSSQEGRVRYRFFSDFPFATRAAHTFNRFERNALAELRAKPNLPVHEETGSLFDRQIRLAMPIVMSSECVTCHNSHPDSQKRDWKVGDVRGIQEIIINQPIAAGIFAFRYLLIYFAAAATLGLAFILLQRRQAAVIAGVNRRLEQANDFLASISSKIAKYLSPQLYRSIFSGEKDVVVATERKKLTIFFSDIVNFTATTERMQPEALAALLNEYLTEMATIAIEHGGTVDKFIGDAILVFFGDPESRGEIEDAKACVSMAIAMQRRLGALNAKWRGAGIEQPFRARMGINTGFCNVGNFGSDDRMDYTIIGGEANLAARLQSIAEPGGLVLSYETYALTRDIVAARPLPAITVKGIARPIVPYAVDGLISETRVEVPVVNEHADGLDVYIDIEGLDGEAADRAVRVLRSALDRIEARRMRPAAGSN